MDLPLGKNLIAKLQKIIDGPNAKERERAIAKLAELGRAGNREAVTVLSESLFDEWNFDSPKMRISIVRALASTNSPEAARALISAADNPGGPGSKDISVASAKALGTMRGTHIITDALLRIINAKVDGFPLYDNELRAEAAKSIGQILSRAPGEYPRMVRLLSRIALSKTENVDVKLAAIEALGESGSRAAIKPLYALLSTESILSRRQESANPYNRGIAYSSAAKALQNLSSVQDHGREAELALSRAERKNESAREAIIAIMEPPSKKNQKQSEPQREKPPAIAAIVPARQQPPEEPAKRRRQARA